jgi:acyl-CoA synthetase (AMP-forming)/AMP-acid ligase II
MRLIDYFDRGAQLAPQAPCFSDLERSLSYAEVAADTLRIANALRGAGLPEGAIVATLTPNHLRAFEPVLGIQRAGMVWLPLNVRYGPDELLHAVTSNDCDFLFVHSSLAPLVRELRARCPRIAGVVAIDQPDGDIPGLEAWMAQACDAPVDVAQAGDTVVRIASSGGTTGPSKGIVQTNETVETQLSCMLAMIPMGPRPVHLAAAPLSHMAGALCWPVMMFGGQTVILPKADPGTILEAIPRFGVTVLALTPTMVYMLLDHPQAAQGDYRSLRNMIYSGAPMSVDKLKRAVRVFGPVMTQAFGQAEASFMCTVLTPAEHVVDGDAQAQRRLHSCGRPTPFVRVGIVDEQGAPVPPGTHGEVGIRSNLVSPGYYKNPQASAAVRKAGWHLTGDIGYQDAQGYLYIVDRKRDLIISGGFNLFPGEIEQVIWGHPAVKDCAVIGVPDEKWGEAVKAVIELRAGAAADPQEIIALCRERLGPMKAPKTVEFWDELPRSSIGKVLKREIRAKFWQAQERAV